jgi:choice-of-anchor A domain-containing protein
VLVNVSGTSAQTNYAGYSYNNTSLNDPTNVNSGKILWNFSEATQLDLRSIGGTIFAPKADVTSYYNAVNGQIVAKSFTGTGQTNYHPFTGNLPTVQTVPEPATLAIFGVGFLGLLRRRASRKA